MKLQDAWIAIGSTMKISLTVMSREECDTRLHRAIVCFCPIDPFIISKVLQKLTKLYYFDAAFDRMTYSVRHHRYWYGASFSGAAGHLTTVFASATHSMRVPHPMCECHTQCVSATPNVWVPNPMCECHTQCVSLRLWHKMTNPSSCTFY